MLLSCVVLNALGARLEREVFDDCACSKVFKEKKVVVYTKSKTTDTAMNCANKETNSESDRRRDVTCLNCWRPSGSKKRLCQYMDWEATYMVLTIHSWATVGSNDFAYTLDIHELCRSPLWWHMRLAE